MTWIANIPAGVDPTEKISPVTTTAPYVPPVEGEEIGQETKVTVPIWDSYEQETTDDEETVIFTHAIPATGKFRVQVGVIGVQDDDSEMWHQDFHITIIDGVVLGIAEGTKTDGKDTAQSHMEFAYVTDSLVGTIHTGKKAAGDTFTWYTLIRYDKLGA